MEGYRIWTGVSSGSVRGLGVPSPALSALRASSTRYGGRERLKQRSERDECALSLAVSPFVARAIHQRLFLAAVDFDHGAVDHVHQWGREHDDEVSDLFDLGDAPHRNGGGRKLIGVLVGELHVARHRLDEAGPALGADRAGVDRAEADMVLAVLAGERKREVLPRSIGSTRRDLP